MEIADDEVDHWQREETAIDAVEPTAVAWQQSAAIFDACAALQGGLAEVADLAREFNAMAAALSAFGKHWCSWTLVNCAIDPQQVS